MSAGRIATRSEAATIAAGVALGSLVVPGDIVLLSGDLGAGKTRLTKGIAEGMGIEGTVTSPTFNILLVRNGPVPLYHFDLYRLERESQLEDIDYWGTLESGGVSVVEWGDRFPGALPRTRITITISIVGDDERSLSVEARGGRAETLRDEWLEACASIPDVSVAGEDRHA